MILARYLVVVAVVLGSLVAAYAYGVSVGKDRETATQARIDKSNSEVRDLALKSAAEAISKIKVQNTTIKGEVQREIQTNTVYRDCRLPVDGLRIINDALSGQRAISPGDSKLPRADSDGR